MNLKEMLKELPPRPGVYMMLDSLGNIIYVGKAKSLKNRVSQYFRSQKDRAPKVAEMIDHIHSFKYTVTDTELDAFVEECRLIKELKPRYNRQLKNTANYLYIKIPNEPYPKVVIVKHKDADGGVYFGPFTSRHRVENALRCLHDFYPIRKCTGPGLAKRANGCLFRQLGSCLGVCTGQVDQEEYRAYIDKIQLLLSGNDAAAVEELLDKVNSAVQELKFELAAQYREYYLGLRHVTGKQRLVQVSSKNRNILAVEFFEGRIAKLFYIKGNRLLHGEVINMITDNTDLAQRLKASIRLRFGSEKSQAPRLSQQDLDEAQIIYSYLKKNKGRISSFWIPASRLAGATAGLEETVTKILNRLSGGNRPDTQPV